MNEKLEIVLYLFIPSLRYLHHVLSATQDSVSCSSTLRLLEDWGLIQQLQQPHIPVCLFVLAPVCT